MWFGIPPAEVERKRLIRRARSRQRLREHSWSSGDGKSPSAYIGIAEDRARVFGASAHLPVIRLARDTGENRIRGRADGRQRRATWGSADAISVMMGISGWLPDQRDGEGLRGGVMNRRRLAERTGQLSSGEGEVPAAAVCVCEDSAAWVGAGADLPVVGPIWHKPADSDERRAFVSASPH
jgi:hypothetical protein